VAPHLPLCRWRPIARGAGLAAGLWLGLAGLAGACAELPHDATAMAGSVVTGPVAQGIAAAWYQHPTTRYAHGVLGDTVEAGTLAVQILAAPECLTVRIALPQDEVFEDLAPRLFDVNGDGMSEVIVVQSSARLGAKLAVYGLTPDGADLTLYAATPNIGRRNRWLAPIGAADLDGDGAIEIAYIDRPHLARTLRVWRFVPTGLAQGELVEVAAAGGLTNHRIGEAFISSGIRDCGSGPEMITADAGWTQVVATRLTASGEIEARSLGQWSQAALAEALACRR
jgi:hypothetical protein